MAKGKILKFVEKYIPRISGRKMLACSVNISESDLRKLQILAGQSKKSVGDEIRNALGQYLKKHEI